MQLPRIFHSPDGGTSADSSEAALDHTFGALSTIRPDLAAAEVKEREQQKAGIAPRLSAEVGRPKLDSEAVEPKPEEVAPDAAREAPPAKGDEKTGSDHESPDNDDAALDALVAKYKGQPKSMATAIREIRSLQTRTAEEKKELEDRIGAASAVLDSDYDVVDGKYVLKADVAARHLRAQRGNGAGPTRMPTEAEIRSTVEADFRKYGEKLVEDEHIPAYLNQMKPLIDQTVNERMVSARAHHDYQKTAMQVAVGDVIGRHLAAHPEDKEILSDIDSLYAGIPEEARIIALLEDWLPLGTVAELVRIKKSLPTIVKDAYELGKKSRGQSATLTEGGSPGRSRPAPTGGRGSSSEAVRVLKENVLRGSGLPSLDDLFAK
jgi:hypothetical protein